MHEEVEYAFIASMVGSMAQMKLHIYIFFFFIMCGLVHIDKK